MPLDDSCTRWDRQQSPPFSKASMGLSSIGIYIINEPSATDDSRESDKITQLDARTRAYGSFCCFTLQPQSGIAGFGCPTRKPQLVPLGSLGEGNRPDGSRGSIWTSGMGFGG